MQHKMARHERNALSYRDPMSVTAVRYYSGCPKLFSYPICPRCKQPMEREYQSFCDHCGQKLDWSQLSKAVTVIV